MSGLIRLMKSRRAVRRKGVSRMVEQTRAEWFRKKRRVLFYAAAGFLCLTTPCSSSSFGPADGICDEFTLKSHAEADSRGAGRRRQHAQTKVGRKRSESSFRRLASLVADGSRHGGSRWLKIRNVIASIKKEQQEMTAAKFLERLDRALRRRGHRESGRGNARYRWFMKPSGIRALWLRRGKKGSLFGSIKKALPLTSVIRLARRSRGGSKAARTSALCKAVTALRSTRKSTKLPLDTAAMACLIEAPEATKAPHPKPPRTLTGNQNLCAPLLGGSPPSEELDPPLVKRWFDRLDFELKDLSRPMLWRFSRDLMSYRIENLLHQRTEEFAYRYSGLDEKQRKLLRTILNVRYRCQLEEMLPLPEPDLAQENESEGNISQSLWRKAKCSKLRDYPLFWVVRRFGRWIFHEGLTLAEDVVQKVDKPTIEKWGKYIADYKDIAKERSDLSTEAEITPEEYTKEEREKRKAAREKRKAENEKTFTSFSFHSHSDWFEKCFLDDDRQIFDVIARYLGNAQFAQRFSYYDRLHADGGKSHMTRELNVIADGLVKAVQEASEAQAARAERHPPDESTREMREIFRRSFIEGLLERVIRNRLDPIFKAGGADDPKASWSQWEAWEKDLAMCDEVIKSVSGPLVGKIFGGRNPQQEGWDKRCSIQ